MSRRSPQTVALCAYCHPLSRRTAPTQVAFGGACCLRHRDGSSACGTLCLSGALLGVHSSLRPAHSLTPPSKDLSVSFADRDLPRRHHPSYAASTFYRLGTFTLPTHGNLQASHRDDKYWAEFARVAQGIGARVIRTAVRAPNMNALVERFLRSARRASRRPRDPRRPAARQRSSRIRRLLQ
jgi:hypothetical protein